jgi:hypothetical protein
MALDQEVYHSKAFSVLYFTKLISTKYVENLSITPSLPSPDGPGSVVITTLLNA